MQYSLARIMRECVDTQCIVGTWVDKTRQTVSIQGLLDNCLDKSARNLETVEKHFFYKCKLMSRSIKYVKNNTRYFNYLIHLDS